MIRNVIWGVSSLPDPCNKDNDWDNIINLYIFTLDKVKNHINSLKEGSEADQYVIQNLTRSGEIIFFIRY